MKFMHTLPSLLKVRGSSNFEVIGYLVLNILAISATPSFKAYLVMFTHRYESYECSSFVLIDINLKFMCSLICVSNLCSPCFESHSNVRQYTCVTENDRFSTFNGLSIHTFELK